MNLILLKSAVIETDGARAVEMVFTDGPEPELAQEVLTFRVPVDAEGYPRIPEAHLEALQSVRSVIGDEIQRLTRIRGQDD